MTSTITVTDTQGISKEIQLVTGLTLMELLRDEGYEEILAMCGGCCSCATCHVHILPDESKALPAVEEDEAMLLMAVDNYEADRSRLSCQVPMTEQQAGMSVVLVEPQ